MGQEDKGSTGAFVFDHFWRSCVNATIFPCINKNLRIYVCATQELERQAAATCKADALRNRPSKLIKSKSKQAQEKTDLGPDR